MIAVVRCGAGSVEGPRGSTRGTKTIIKNVALVSVVEETHGVETALKTRRTPGTALPQLLRTSFVVPRVWLGPGLWLSCAHNGESQSRLESAPPLFCHLPYPPLSDHVAAPGDFFCENRQSLPQTMFHLLADLLRPSKRNLKGFTP